MLHGRRSTAECKYLLIITNTVKSYFFVEHLISFISWVNKIHEIKCQRKYLFPIHLTDFNENPRN